MASIYHLLNRQIPAHVREQYPVFCKFIEYYYRWLQTRGFDKLEKVTNIDYECQAISLKDCFTRQKNQDGSQLQIDSEEFAKSFIGYTVINDNGVVAEIVGSDRSKIIIRYLTQDKCFELNDQLYIRQNTKYEVDENRLYDKAVVSQLQTLPSAYIDHFAKLLDGESIFDTNNANIALILKHVKHLYQSKGSEHALKYILKATQNVDTEINYPWKQVLKPSDGKWSRRFAVNIKVNKNTWTNIPTKFDRVFCEIKSTDPLHPEPSYVERVITKIELFGRQSQNYDIDDEGGWWHRDNSGAELDYDRIVRDEYGNIIFYGNEYNNSSYYPNTYGEYEIYSRQCVELEYEQNDDGSYKLDSQGNKIPVYKRDTNGNLILDWRGNKIPVHKKDAEGKYIPIYLMEYLKDDQGNHILDDGKFISVPVLDKDGNKIIFNEQINSDRLVTPYIRLYFDSDPEVYDGQRIFVVGLTELDNGEYQERVLLDGNVTVGVKGFDIVNPGKKWQVGQIFTAEKQSLWQLYTQPTKHTDSKGFEYDNSVTTNAMGVLVQYSTDVPLIGRVTAIGPMGEIQSAEIVQLGDHLPQNAGKRIVVSPLFNPQLDSTPFQAEIDLVYGPQVSVTGRFEDNSGMLSDNEIRLQDNFYYQKFSYDIIANTDPATYIDIANKMHPAGSKMFTTYVLESDLDNTVNTDVMSGTAFMSLSLFDVAVVADKLTKTTIKRLSDKVIIDELLTLVVKKALKDNFVVCDSSKDRVYLYEHNQSYDMFGDESYLERDYDGDDVNTSYSNFGYEKRLYINYEYQTIPEQYKR